MNSTDPSSIPPIKRAMYHDSLSPELPPFPRTLSRLISDGRYWLLAGVRSFLQMRTSTILVLHATEWLDRPLTPSKYVYPLGFAKDVSSNPSLTIYPKRVDVLDVDAATIRVLGKLQRQALPRT